MPLTTCAEENILGYQIDKYHAEDILVHEFAHSIHLIGILTVYPDFNERLKKAYDAALAAGKGKIPMPRPISKSIGPKEYRIGLM